MELVHRVAHQSGRPLGLVEEEDRRVDHLAIGEAADAQAVLPPRARQAHGGVVAAPHGEGEARREAVQLLVTRLLGGQFGEGRIGQLATALLHQLLVEHAAALLAAFQQSLHGFAGLAVQSGKDRRLALEHHLTALGVSHWLADAGHRPGAVLRRHRGVVGAPLVVHPGVVTGAVLRAGVTAPFQHVGIDVLARAMPAGQQVVTLARRHLAGGVEAVLQVAAGIHPGEIATLLLATGRAPAGRTLLLQPLQIAAADAPGRLLLLLAVAVVDEAVVHAAVVVDPGQVAPAAGLYRRQDGEGEQDGNERLHQKVVV